MSSHPANPYRAYEIVNLLERDPIIISQWSMRHIIQEDLHEAVEKCITQSVLLSGKNQGVNNLIEFLDGNTEGKCFPFPSQWLQKLKQQGISVAAGRSKAAFFIAQCRAWYRGGVKFFDLIRCQFGSYREETAKHSFFLNLPPDSYLETPDIKLKNFRFWLIDNGELEPDELVYLSSSKGKGESSNITRIQTYHFPRLTGAGFLGFLLNSIRIVGVSVVKWVFGKWACPFIVSYALEAEYFRHVRYPARRYVFNNSNFAVRPLWTYLAERRGCNVLLYFYSANITTFYLGQKKDAGYVPGYALMSWPHYWVLDDTQKKFLEYKLQVPGLIKVKGTIDFNDSPQKLPDIPKKSVVLFDIPIFKKEYLSDNAIIAPYYTAKISSMFIEHIMAAVFNAGGYVVWKQKREMTNTKLDPLYLDLLEKYSNHQNVIMLASNTNAKRVVQKVRGAVSFPFTSTALAARETGIPSIYYDPTGGLNYFDYLSHDIPVLSTRMDLEMWVQQIFRLGD